jgi:hypothetical protein
VPSGIVPTQALIKKHIANIQMKRIWLNRNGTNNTAKWAYLNTSLVSGRSINLMTKIEQGESTLVPDTTVQNIEKSFESVSKIN